MDTLQPLSPVDVAAIVPVSSNVVVATSANTTASATSVAAVGVGCNTPQQTFSVDRAPQSVEDMRELMQKASTNGSQADKARSQIVTYWLNENYKACEGVSIPRSDLYDHYCEYCRRNSMSHVNSASFGKLIRTVFPNLKTRRLGNRGKSKYHYCGLKIRLNSADTSFIPSGIIAKSQLAPPSPDHKGSVGSDSQSDGGDTPMDSFGYDKLGNLYGGDDYIDIMGDSCDTLLSQDTKIPFGAKTPTMSLLTDPSVVGSTDMLAFKQPMMDPIIVDFTDPIKTDGTANSVNNSNGTSGNSISGSLNGSGTKGSSTSVNGSVKNPVIGANTSLSDVISTLPLTPAPDHFGKRDFFTGAAQAPFVYSPAGASVTPFTTTPLSSPLATGFEGQSLSASTRTLLVFYRNHCKEIASHAENLDISDISRTLKEFWALRSTSSLEEAVKELGVVELIRTMDMEMYDIIMNRLVPNVMTPIDLSKVQKVSRLASEYCKFLEKALDRAPKVIVDRKMEVARVFCEQLARHTALNKLMRIAGVTLADPKQRQQMLLDWETINFTNIQEQVSWMAGAFSYEGRALRHVFSEIKFMLSSGATLEAWTDWLEAVVDRFVDMSLDMNQYTREARAFLLKWEFYGSMAARDLTLRSASSFGSFHVVRQMFGEYLFYFIEQRIALARRFEVDGDDVCAPQSSSVSGTVLSTTPAPASVPSSGKRPSQSAAAAAAAVAAGVLTGFPTSR